MVIKVFRVFFLGVAGLISLLGLVALASGLLGSLSHPQAAAAEKFTLIGAGVSSCGTWTADRSSPNGNGAALQDEQWVLGFLSAFGFANPTANPLGGLDADAVWGWFDNYCRDHPLVKISQASYAFYLEHPRQVPSQ